MRLHAIAWISELDQSVSGEEGKELMLNTKEEGKIEEGNNQRKICFYTTETFMVTPGGIAEKPLLPGRESESLWVPFIHVKNRLSPQAKGL